MSEVDTSAIERNGAAGLDALLAEFDSSVGARADGSGNAAPADRPSVDATDSEVLDHTLTNGATLEDLVDPSSTYWRDREQASYAVRAKQEAEAAQQVAQQYLQQAAKIRDDADTEILLKEIRGDFDSTFFDDSAVRGFVLAQATENPFLHQAWNERHQNPAVYNAAVKQLSKAFATWANSRPDPDLTSDRDMVAAAVRGASQNRAPEDRPPAYGHMTNSDFRNDVRSRYGFDPGV